MKNEEMRASSVLIRRKAQRVWERVRRQQSGGFDG